MGKNKLKGSIMAIVNECEQKIIQGKVKKLIQKSLDQKGISSIGLRELCKRKVKELKTEHDYVIMNHVGRVVTMLIKDGKARIGYSDTIVLRFYATT
jgi:hypothetical protein